MNVGVLNLYIRKNVRDNNKKLKDIKYKKEQKDKNVTKKKKDAQS